MDRLKVTDSVLNEIHPISEVRRRFFTASKPLAYAQSEVYVRDIHKSGTLRGNLLLLPKQPGFVGSEPKARQGRTVKAILAGKTSVRCHRWSFECFVRPVADGEGGVYCDGCDGQPGRRELCQVCARKPMARYPEHQRLVHSIIDVLGVLVFRDDLTFLHALPEPDLWLGPCLAPFQDKDCAPVIEKGLLIDSGAVRVFVRAMDERHRSPTTPIWRKQRTLFDLDESSIVAKDRSLATIEAPAIEKDSVGQIHLF